MSEQSSQKGKRSLQKGKGKGKETKGKRSAAAAASAAAADDADYAVFFLVQIKDRHDGNILLKRDGRFGAPGLGVGFHSLMFGV